VTVLKIVLTGLLTLSLDTSANAQQTPEQKYKEVASRAGAPTVVRRYGPDDLRSGQLRLPSGKGPFPVAVIVHGGCWTASYDTMAGTAAVAEALTKRGIATWNIEYRRLGDTGAGWPGTFEDVGAGIDFVEALAREYPLDLLRVTIVGHSSGAHLALWGASRAKLGPLYAPRVRPVSVVQIDGPASLAPFVGVDAKVCGKPVITELMGGTPAARAEQYAMASPAAHLPLGIRQLLVQAAFTPFMAGYVETARKAGDQVEVLQGGDDHFDVVTPGTPVGDHVIDLIAKRAFENDPAADDRSELHP
jgi:pimeloyl-ACP methyl ester carboxylesterase